MGKTIESSNKKTSARRAARAIAPSYRTTSERADASKRISRRADRHRTSAARVDDRTEVYCLEVHIDPEFRGRSVQVMSNMPHVRDAPTLARLLNNAMSQDALDWHNAGEGDLVARSERVNRHHPVYGLMAKGDDCLTPEECLNKLLVQPNGDAAMATTLEALRGDHARLQREFADLAQKHQALLAEKHDATTPVTFAPLPSPEEASKQLLSFDPNFQPSASDCELVDWLLNITANPTQPSAMECTSSDADGQLAKELADHARELELYAARVMKELAIEQQQHTETDDAVDTLFPTCI